MPQANFVHLHNHTMYSLLDGANRIEDLAGKAAEWGMPAMAMTDHGNLFGAVEFYKEMRNVGVKPILGCEVYTAIESRHSRKAARGINSGSNHLLLLAENTTGYRNLIKLVSKGYLEGFYYNPRIDKELLRQYAEGLICMSACLNGEISHLILMGHPEKAREVAIEYLDIFGENNVFLEIQRHPGIDDEVTMNKGIIALAKDLGIPLVATNDAHYLERSHARAHEILLCIQTGKTLDDPKRMRFGCDEVYVKSEAEMRELFSDVPEAIDITVEIAARCDVEITFGQNLL
ncbi:MAG: PHP domain-containing protein, partial [Candidatus Latescibacteria bacterium]|nr:PHP domain-containing protein [Candidatus Latescibacterota bacterium]